MRVERERGACSPRSTGHAVLPRALALGDVDEAVAIAACTGHATGRIVLAALRESLQPAPRVEATLLAEQP